MDKNKYVILNVIVSTLAQIITLSLGLILPRIILTSWGSEYNGLINSVTTVMRYLALLEAGVGASTLQALYKAIGEKNQEKTSIIISSAQNYYHKVSFIYATLVVIISFVYPLFLKTTIPYWEIFFVILLQGLTGVINFSFRAAYQQLLNAEGKYYIISIITLLTTILTYIAKIISISILNSIIIMQLLGILIMLFQVIIYANYFKRKYNWLNKKAVVDMSTLENRKYYIVQQISGMIFNSTDTIVLSMVCGLKVVSVYMVYNMIYSALTVLINICRSSTNFVLGQAFYTNKEKFVNVYNLYTSFQMILGSFLSSCSIVMIIGFVKLYTKGINDIVYTNYFAAILFSINIMLDCSRGASLACANVAGKAPNTTWRYVAEASINLVVSLILVNVIGMNGVLIGTVVAGIWRSIDSIVYFNHKVLNRDSKKELIFVLINFVLFTFFATWAYIYEITFVNYLEFIKIGLIVVLFAFTIYASIFAVYNRKNLKCMNKISNKRERV